MPITAPEGHQLDPLLRPRPAGFRVLIGSRDEAKAKELAASLRSALSNEDFTAQAEGYTNASAAAAADVVFWAIQAPLAERHAALAALAPELQNKVVVDITNIGYLPDFQMGTSSTLQNAEIVPGARWVAAWKQTFWKLLETPPNRPHSVFVCGNDPEALGLAMRLVEQVPGFHPVDGGGLGEGSPCCGPGPARPSSSLLRLPANYFPVPNAVAPTPPRSLSPANTAVIEPMVPWIVELDKLNTGGNFRGGFKFGL